MSAERKLETLDDYMIFLSEVKAELKKMEDAHREETKNLRETKKSLEAIIIEEVKKRKQTVTVGNLRAEYIPQVVIKMKKEKKNEQ